MVASHHQLVEEALVDDNVGLGIFMLLAVLFAVGGVALIAMI